MSGGRKSWHPLASAGLFILVAGSAVAHTAADEIPELLPTRVVALPPNASDPLLAPDGGTVYLTQTLSGINIWAVLVSWWPELGAAVAGLITLIAARVLWRAVRHPRIPGAPYCRKCGYCLKGAPSDVCPECGDPSAVPRARKGRSTLRRVAPAVACALTLWLGWGALHLAGIPRQGRVSGWFNWWSTDLLAWADAHSWTGVTDQSETFARVIAMDLASGQTLQSLLDYETPFMLAAISDDGRTLIVMNDCNWFASVDAGTGDIQRTWWLPGDPLLFGDPAEAILRGMPVYLERVNQHQMKEIVAYVSGSGEVRTIFAVPAPQYPRTFPAGFFALLGNRPPRAAEIVASNGELQTYAIRDLDRNGEVLWTGEVELWPPIYDEQSQSMYSLTVQLPGALSGTNLPTGKSEPLFPVLPRNIDAQHVNDWHSDGRTVVLGCAVQTPGGGHEHFYAVGDLQEHRWLALLCCPAGVDTCGLPLPKLTRDRRHAFLACVAPTQVLAAPDPSRAPATMPVPVFALMVWDLSERPAP